MQHLLRGTRRVEASIGLQEPDPLRVESISGWSEFCASWVELFANYT